MDPATAMVGSAATGAVGSLGVSALNLWGQQNQRDWEERMANTAYQRAAVDMRAAGLNPSMMFGSGGPAATPNVQPAHFENPLAGVPEAAASAVRLELERGKLANETAITRSEVARKDAETASILLDPARKTAETAKLGAETDRTRAEIPNIQQMLRNLEAQLVGIQAETRFKTASARSLEADLPKKQVVAEGYSAVKSGIDRLKSEFRGKKAPFESSVQPVLDVLVGKPGSFRMPPPGQDGTSAAERLNAASSWLWGKLKERLRNPGAGRGGGSARDVNVGLDAY